jgi:hypothetical protein
LELSSPLAFELTLGRLEKVRKEAREAQERVAELALRRAEETVLTNIERGHDFTECPWPTRRHFHQAKASRPEGISVDDLIRGKKSTQARIKALEQTLKSEKNCTHGKLIARPGQVLTGDIIKELRKVVSLLRKTIKKERLSIATSQALQRTLNRPLLTCLHTGCQVFRRGNSHVCNCCQRGYCSAHKRFLRGHQLRCRNEDTDLGQENQEIPPRSDNSDSQAPAQDDEPNEDESEIQQPSPNQPHTEAEEGEEREEGEEEEDKAEEGEDGEEENEEDEDEEEEEKEEEEKEKEEEKEDEEKEEKEEKEKEKDDDDGEDKEKEEIEREKENETEDKQQEKPERDQQTQPNGQKKRLLRSTGPREDSAQKAFRNPEDRTRSTNYPDARKAKTTGRNEKRRCRR